MEDKGTLTVNLGLERKDKLRKVATASKSTMTGIVEGLIESAHKQLSEMERENGGEVPEVEIITRLKLKKPAFSNGKPTPAATVEVTTE